MISRSIYILLGLAVIVLVWEGAIAFFQLPPYVLPGLAEIGQQIVAEWPALMDGLSMTLFEAVSGYVIGAVVGILLAVLITLVPLVERSLMPIVVAINSVPIVAYVPVSLVALGMGPASKIVMVAVAAGFTIFLSAVQGLKSVDPSAVNLLRSFGASGLRVIWMFRLPAAMPIIVNGLRVAVVRSMIVAIVAEMLGAYAGLGRIIYEATQQIDFLRAWAAIAVASAASLALYGIFVWVDRRLVWWK